MNGQRVMTVLSRAVHLRCPRCGRAPLFRSLFTMYERCSACGLVFEREQGYFVGAIYVNYAVTVGISIAGFFLLDRVTAPHVSTQIAIWSAFGIAFPLAFFRYSRSLWLSVEYLVNPEAPELRSVR